MSSKRMQDQELTAEELEAQVVAELPPREALSVVNGNVAAPINPAVAVNMASDHAVTYTNSSQFAPFTQGL